MALIGRDRDISRLVERKARIVLLAGDSGVGKSEVLRAVQDASGVALAPPPVHLRRAPGALQRGLIEALAAAVSKVATDQSGIQRIGALVVAAASRVAEVQLRDLASCVGRHFLGIISNRLSPELAVFLESFTKQLVTPADAELVTRISNAGDRDVVDLVCRFASEVRDLTESRLLVLALDDGDRLDESDRRRLSDLASMLPGGVTVRIAYSTWSSQTHDQVDELAQSGVDIVELEGLDKAAIQEWLIAANLQGSWAPQVFRTTNGYALHVKAAIELLAETNSIAELSGMTQADVIGVTTRRVWRELDTSLKVAAQRLCAFSAPLNAVEASAFLGIEQTVWHSFERNFVDSRVFTGHPPWFHELRRRYIFFEILNNAEREVLLNTATLYRKDRIALPGAKPEEFVEYATLTALNTSLLEQNPKAAEVIQADRDEVAIAATLIELSQPTSSALLADSVLLYAQQVYGATGDLPAAVERISERGFVYITSDAQATVLVPTWGSLEVMQLFAGRAAAELGRLPTPQLATVAFESVLRPRLGQFRTGHHGVGSPRISELSYQATQLQRVQADGTLVFDKLGPNLLVRYEYDGLPFYAAIAYDEEGERNAAEASLRGLNEASSDHNFSVLNSLRSPMPCVPSLRFFLAMERLTEKSLVNANNGPSSVLPKLETPISLDYEMSQRALTLETVRRMCTDVERLAASLEFPIGYFYRGTAEMSEAIQVIGRTGAERFAGDPVVSLGNRLHRFDLARDANLELGEHLGLIYWQQGTQQVDPVLHELLWVFQQSARFNEYQERVPIKFDSDSLSAAITATSVQIASDALELKSALGIVISDEDLQRRGLQGSKTCVVLQIDKPDPHWVPGAHATIIATTVANQSGEHSAEVIVVAPEEAIQIFGSDFNDRRTIFANLFNIDVHDIVRLSQGIAINSLAKLLAHRTSEVRFEY